MKLRNLILVCMCYRTVFGVDFFPTQDRYLLQMLELKQRDWTRDGMITEVKLLKNEKILINVRIPSQFYLFERNWRTHAEAFIRSIFPKVVQLIRRYASDEFLSVFDPKYDIQWDIYLHNTLYGRIRDGKVGFKKGLY